MITKFDVMDRAAEWQLRPEIVEKDYIIGWLLTGFSANPETSSNWIFKGGTCLKKCYFETYRFSEDLDFSLTQNAIYTEQEIKNTLLSLAEYISKLSGITFPTANIVVDSKKNLKEQPTFKAKLAYIGPLQKSRDPYRILLDLTKHEPILDTPNKKQIFHPYPDRLPPNTTVSTYSIEEVMAEKMRALFERTRPRDLYDVVYLLENRLPDINLNITRQIFSKKCNSKGFDAPDIARLRERIFKSEELRSEWSNMLAHQLPQLPSVDDYLKRIDNLLSLFFATHEIRPIKISKPLPLATGESAIAQTGIRYWGTGNSLEILRFAATNHLLVTFNYHGKERLVEPYSVHQAKTGNLLFYGWELANNHIKAFKTDEMTNIKAISTSFIPRYRIY